MTDNSTKKKSKKNSINKTEMWKLFDQEVNPQTPVECV